VLLNLSVCHFKGDETVPCGWKSIIPPTSLGNLHDIVWRRDFSSSPIGQQYGDLTNKFLTAAICQEEARRLLPGRRQL
jgi:hypothetical protein